MVTADKVAKYVSLMRAPEVAHDNGLCVRSLESGTRYYIRKSGSKWSVVNKDDTDRPKGVLKSGLKSKQVAIDYATKLIKNDFRAFVRKNPNIFR